MTTPTETLDFTITSTCERSDGVVEYTSTARMSRDGSLSFALPTGRTVDAPLRDCYLDHRVPADLLARAESVTHVTYTTWSAELDVRHPHPYETPAALCALHYHDGTTQTLHLMPRAQRREPLEQRVVRFGAARYYHAALARHRDLTLPPISDEDHTWLMQQPPR